MSKRKSIKTSTRFEVFRRDGFTCQYCGSKSPDVILEIDHIRPVADGGDNSILNLITACWACNSGKGARLLDDDAMVQKQRAQLEDLQKKRDQIDMMVQWKTELSNLKDYETQKVEAFVQDKIGCALSVLGQKAIAAVIRKYGIAAVMDAIVIAAEQYIKVDSKGVVDFDSQSHALGKVKGICHHRANNNANPSRMKLYYIRGILRNRLSYCNDRLCMDDLTLAYESGASLESLQELALGVRTWTQFRTAIGEFLPDDCKAVEGE